MEHEKMPQQLAGDEILKRREQAASAIWQAGEPLRNASSVLFEIPGEEENRNQVIRIMEELDALYGKMTGGGRGSVKTE